MDIWSFVEEEWVEVGYLCYCTEEIHVRQAHEVSSFGRARVVWRLDFDSPPHPSELVTGWKEFDAGCFHLRVGCGNFGSRGGLWIYGEEG